MGEKLLMGGRFQELKNAVALIKTKDAAPEEVEVEGIKVPTLDAEGKKKAAEFLGFDYDLDNLGHKYNPFTVSVRTADSGLAFLVGELEKRDTALYEPLTTYYWQRDMPLRSGGGAVEFISFMNVNWGTTEANNGYIANNTDAIDTMSVDIDKTIGQVRMWAKLLKVGFKDMLQSEQIGRSLEQLLDRGIVIAYNKELDKVTMEGWDELSVPGLFNNPNVQSALVADNADASSKLWVDKTPDEILTDINEILTSVWETAEYDVDGMPNRLLITPDMYGYISTIKVSDAGNISILEYVLQNNIARRKGVDFQIWDNRYAVGAGQGGTARMVAYNYNDDKIRFHLPIPLTRAFTNLDASKFAYLTPYYAFISQVEFVYTETIAYRDGY